MWPPTSKAPQVDRQWPYLRGFPTLRKVTRAVLQEDPDRTGETQDVAFPSRQERHEYYLWRSPNLKAEVRPLSLESSYCGRGMKVGALEV